MSRSPSATHPVARLSLSCALAMLLVLSGCARREPLQIALHPWIGYETLTLADEFGWLPEGVELLRGDSVDDSLNALRSGRAQVAAITLDEALRLRADMPSLVIVLVMNESAGADMLLARPDIEQLTDLAGRTVAYQDRAVNKLLLRGALHSAGLSFTDLQLVDLPVNRQADAYRDGRVDAVVTYLPYAQAVLDTGARRLFDSSSLPGTIIDVLVCDQSYLTGRREALRGTIAAHFRALTYLRHHADDAVYRIAGYQQQGAASIRDALSGVRLPALEVVRLQLAPGEYLASVGEQLLALGAIPELPDADAFTVAFLPSPGPR